MHKKLARMVDEVARTRGLEMRWAVKHHFGYRIAFILVQAELFRQSCSGKGYHGLPTPT